MALGSLPNNLQRQVQTCSDQLTPEVSRYTRELFLLYRATKPLTESLFFLSKAETPTGAVTFNVEPRKGDDPLALHFGYDALVADSVARIDRDSYWTSLKLLKILFGAVVKGGSALVAEVGATEQKKPFLLSTYRKIFGTIHYMDSLREGGTVRNYFLLEDKLV